MARIFTVEDEFSETIARYVSREMGKGKDPRRSMSRVMVDWLFQAMRYALPSDTDDIVLYLMGQTRLRSGQTRRKRAAVVNEMQDTLALAIVRSGKYTRWNAKNLPSVEAARMAKKYIAARKFSAGLLKSGFFPALRELKKGAPGKFPRYQKHPPGELIPFRMTADEISIGATNFAKFIAERYPNAFENGMPAVIARFTKFMQDDMLAEQNAAGLNGQRS